jgi:signal peptidase II
MKNPESPALNSVENNQNQGIGSAPLPMSRFGLFLLPLLLVAVADLITKSVVFDRFYSLKGWGNEPNWWIDGILGIQTSTNPGALFGLGAGYSWLFAILSIIVFSIIISWLFFFGGARDRWLTFAFGLVSGGIIGNLYDRLGLGFVPGRPMEIQYHVRDWIHFRLQGVPFFDPWPNFNLADAGLVVGAMLLLLHAFFVPPEGKPNEPGFNRQVVPNKEL